MNPTSSPLQAVPDLARVAIQRYIGIDAHKEFVTVAYALRGSDQPPQTLARKVPITQLTSWAQTHLTRQDAVVLEASTNAWTLYDELTPLVHSVTVANPNRVWLIAHADVKTDQHDAQNLAKLHAAGLIPAVWVPPAEVRELRNLMNQRRRLTGKRTQALNRLQAVLHRHHVTPPDGALDAESNRTWWHDQPLSRVEHLQVRQDLAQLASVQLQLAEVDQLITELAADEPRLILLVQLPGIALLSAMQILAAIGDVTRFPSAKKLVGYAGLGIRLHQTGQTTFSGRITKAGRRDLRWIMTEVAWNAVRTHPHWQAEFQRLTPRLGDKKAVVAIARKLLVVVWHVLTFQVADRHAQPEAVARKLFTFASSLRRAGRQGQTTAAFTRDALDQLALGSELTTLRLSRTEKVVLPPSARGTPSPG